MRWKVRRHDGVRCRSSGGWAVRRHPLGEGGRCSQGSEGTGDGVSKIGAACQREKRLLPRKEDEGDGTTTEAVRTLNHPLHPGWRRAYGPGCRGGKEAASAGNRVSITQRELSPRGILFLMVLPYTGRERGIPCRRMPILKSSRQPCSWTLTK